MYYRKALEIHAFFDMAERKGQSYTFFEFFVSCSVLELTQNMVFHALDIFKGYEAVLDTKSDDKELAQLHTRIQAIADMKLTYVVSCQEDEFHKRTGESRANDIVRLLQE